MKFKRQVNRVLFSVIALVVQQRLAEAGILSPYGLELGANTGFGQLSGAGVESRIVNMVGISGAFYYDVFSFIPAMPATLNLGVGTEFRFLTELSTPTEQFTSSGLFLGPYLGTELALLRAAIVLDLIGSHSISSERNNGVVWKIKSPLGARFQLGLKLLPFATLDAFVSTTAFSHFEKDGTEVDTVSDKISYWTAGLGLHAYF